MQMYAFLVMGIYSVHHERCGSVVSIDLLKIVFTGTTAAVFLIYTSPDCSHGEPRLEGPHHLKNTNKQNKQHYRHGGGGGGVRGRTYVMKGPKLY